MFETDAAHPVSDGVEKFVAIIMLCTEELDRLINEIAVQLDGLGFGGQFLLAVCHRVERNALAEIILAEIFAGKDRAVDQDFVIGGFISDGVARRGRGAQRGRGLPAFGISHGGRHRDLAGEVTGRIKRDRFPLDVHHLGRHDDAALIGGRRGNELKADVECLCVARDINRESVNVNGIAFPDQCFAAGFNDQPCELFDLPARGVIAGKPFGEEQCDRAVFDRNALLDAENGTVDVGRVNFQCHCAGIGNVLCDGDRIDDRQRLRCAVGSESGG